MKIIHSNWSHGCSLNTERTRQQVYVQCNIKARSQSLLPWKSNNCYVFCVCACACARSCVYSGAWACACACVHVALLIQIETRMRYTVTSFVAPLAPPHFSTLSLKGHDFRKKKAIEYKMCFNFLYNFYPNISHSKKNVARYKYCHKCEKSSCKVPIILLWF